MGMCADFAIHDTDGHNPHAHILLTVRPLNENGTWQYKTEKEYLCIKDGEEKGFTASEFKTAQKQGWEKQYRYKVGKKKEYLTSSVAQEKGYERIDKHPKRDVYKRQVPNIAMKNKRNIRVPETPSFTLPGFCQKNKTYPTQESINKYNI